MERSTEEPQSNDSKRKHLEYAVDDIPSLHITLLYSLQQVVSNLAGPLAAVYILHKTLCTEGRDSGLLYQQLLSTSLFMMGVASFIQSTFGIRLPVLQGSSFVFLPPVTAMMITDRWKCPPLTYQGNHTDITEMETPWIPRLREINGCLMVASCLQVFIGCTGMIGYLMNYIGPITICPTLALIGLSLFSASTEAAQHQWGIALMTIALVMIFSLVLCDIKLPLPTWTKSSGFTLEYYKIFKLYPHVFAIIIGWTLCYVLTITDSLPDDPSKLGYFARTDVKGKVLHDAKWFYFPYPLQWGVPTFSVGLFVGFIGATIANILESVGDYYATANVAQLIPPPKHAINRGIALEGIASILSGLMGAAHATTSYSATVGFVQITGVASRFVWQIMSLLLILCGLFGKFGAALTMIPDPIIGGLSVLGIGMVIPVGLSTLKYTNMDSSRNQVILATTMMLGLMVPSWMKDNPDIINTGFESVDQLLEVVLSTSTFLGGIIAFILDNLVPGSKEERGLIAYQEDLHTNGPEKEGGEKPATTPYDLPFITPFIRKVSWCRYIPISPSYIQPRFTCPCQSVKKDVNSHKDENGYDVISQNNNGALSDQTCHTDVV